MPLGETICHIWRHSWRINFAEALKLENNKKKEINRKKGGKSGGRVLPRFLDSNLIFFTSPWLLQIDGAMHDFIRLLWKLKYLFTLRRKIWLILINRFTFRESPSSTASPLWLRGCLQLLYTQLITDHGISLIQNCVKYFLTFEQNVSFILFFLPFHFHSFAFSFLMLLQNHSCQPLLLTWNIMHNILFLDTLLFCLSISSEYIFS